jgi:hypothetical protein
VRVSIPIVLSMRPLQEAAIVLVIFAGGALAGSRYMAAYQQATPEDLELSVAVTSACGRGFVSPAAPIPALGAFLQRRVDAFSCDQLPSDLSPVPLGITQTLYRYLMTAVALQWKWSGVSWRGLAPLFGAMFGVTLSAIYGLFRLAGGRVAAIIGVVPLAISAHHLEYLPQLRDYAKAPFIVLLILVMAQLAMPPLRPRRSLLLAAAFGLILGIGFGFRNDLLINLPPFLVTVVLLTPGPSLGNRRLKMACLALTSVTFVVSAWPILAAYRSGSNTGHVAVLGLMSTFDAPLAMTRPAYDLGPRYLDGYAATVITEYSRLRTGRFVDYLSPEYDAAAFRLLTDVGRHWPADLFARGLSSVFQLLDFPFTIGQYTPSVPSGVSAPWLLLMYQWQQSVLRVLIGLGPVLACAVVIVVGASDPRAGVALLSFLLFYCGYPAVQFHVRHFFHLEFVAWGAIVFLFSTAGRATWRVAATRRWPRLSPVKIRNGAMAATAIVAITVIPLALLRLYQQRHLTTLFGGYLQSARRPMAVSRTTRDGRTDVAIDGLWNGLDPADPFGARYVVAEFTSDRCAAIDLPVTATYDAKTPANDFSFVTRVPIRQEGPTVDFVPAYSNGTWSRFAGFSLPAGYDACLKSVSVIDDTSRMPLLVGLRLSPEWRSTSLFQRLAKLETGPHDMLTQTVPEDLASPTDGSVSTAMTLSSDLVAPGVAADTVQRRWSTISPVRITAPRQLLVHFAPREVETGLVLRARGVLRRGGLRIGTSQNEHLVDSRPIIMPGPFTVLLGVPGAGAYAVRVTDEAAMDWRQQEDSLMWHAARLLVPWTQVADFELHDVAWIRPSPMPLAHESK